MIEFIDAIIRELLKLKKEKTLVNQKIGLQKIYLQIRKFLDGH